MSTNPPKHPTGPPPASPLTPPASDLDLGQREDEALALLALEECPAAVNALAVRFHDWVQEVVAVLGQGRNLTPAEVQQAQEDALLALPEAIAAYGRLATPQGCSFRVILLMAIVDHFRTFVRNRQPDALGLPGEPPAAPPARPLDFPHLDDDVLVVLAQEIACPEAMNTLTVRYFGWVQRLVARLARVGKLPPEEVQDVQDDALLALPEAVADYDKVELRPGWTWSFRKVLRMALVNRFRASLHSSPRPASRRPRLGILTLEERVMLSAGLPQVLGLSTHSGPARASTTVTLTGGNFTGATSVHFGDTPAAFTVLSDTAISAQAPPEAPGSVAVTVITPTGSSPLVPDDLFAYLGPAVTAVSPSTGSVNGGEYVTIGGPDLGAVTGVSFGGTPALFWYDPLNHQVDVLTPAHAAGAVDVVVHTRDGATPATLADQFTFAAPPPSAAAALPTSVSLASTASMSTPSLGQPVTFTATVQPGGSGSLSGVVTFLDGNTPLNGTVTYSPSMGGGLQATLSTTDLGAGGHSITAVYGEDPLFIGSPSGSVALTVNQPTTSTTLGSPQSTTTAGQPVTLTATVSPQGPGSLTGSVIFYDGTTPLAGTVTYSPYMGGGLQATLTTSALDSGGHTLTAVYAHDPLFAASNSGSLSLNAGQPTTSIALSSTATTNTATLNQPVTFTATVYPSGGSGSLTGGVTFLDGGTPLAGTVINSPYMGGLQATLTTSALGAGGHRITAVYGNDPLFAGSTSGSLALMVNQPTTSISLGSPPSTNTSTADQAVTFTATVYSSTGASLPGDVTFLDGTTPLAGTVTFSPYMGGLQATLTTSALALGGHTVTAVYAHDPVALGSTSGPLNWTVTPPPAQYTWTALAADLGSSNPGQAVTFTATVNTMMGGSAGSLPGGTVRFYDNGTLMGSGGLSSGSASLTTSTLSAGSHTITASYSGDATFAASTGSLTQVVNPAPTTTVTLASSSPDDSAGPGDAILFEARVSASFGTYGALTGQVTFYNGTTPLAGQVSYSQDMGSLVASLAPVGGLTLGPNSIRAVYAHDPAFPDGASNTLVFTIHRAQAVVSLVPDPDHWASFVHGPATFSGLVVMPQGYNFPPQGVVTLMDGDTVLGAVSQFSAGLEGEQAAMTTGWHFSLTTSALAVGSHAITAVYADPYFDGTTSNTLDWMVWQPTATVTVASSSQDNTSMYGDAVRFTATVQGDDPEALPRGTVTFLDGNTPLGPPVPLTDNTTGEQASLEVYSLVLGLRNIRAVYSGNSTYAGASATLTQTVDPTIWNVTTTTLTADALTCPPGGSVTFTAEPSPSGWGSGRPTGTVVFAVDGMDRAEVALGADGTARFTAPTLADGPHTVMAQYEGDDYFAGSQSDAQTLTVNPGASTYLLLDAGPGPSSALGQTVTLAARLYGGSRDGSPSSGGDGAPTGSVTFRDGDTVLGSPVPVTYPDYMGEGWATLSVSTLAVGSHAITATYNGDWQYALSSAGLTQTVQLIGPLATGTTLTSSANPSLAGRQVSFTATVAADLAGAGAPPGSVTFSDGTTSLGSVNLDALGQATLYLMMPLSLGDHAITAAYNGDGTFTASTSTVLTQTVAQVGTGITLASSANPSLAGRPVILTATVASDQPGVGNPTGTVTFSDGATSLGSAYLDGSSQATLYLMMPLAPGSHSLSAAYGGDYSFTASTSAALTQTVSQVGTGITLASSANPSASGQSVSFTATVTPDQAGEGNPTGSVTFSDGGMTLGSAYLDSSGQATVYLMMPLSVGSHPITAAYGGDYSFTASTSAVLTQTVTPPGTGTPLDPGASPPAVTGLSVVAGPSAGGTSVTISGSNLGAVTGVSFGGTPASMVYGMGSQVYAYAPAHAAGAVDVIVTTPGGNSATSPADQFTYLALAAPVVTSVSPATGPLAGGYSSITLTGTGFTDVTGVLFGTNQVTGYVVNSATQITVSYVPAAMMAGPVDVQVIASGLTSAVSPADQYTYVAPGLPVVTGITPAAGPTSGGTYVTISGTNLTGMTAVSFGGTPASMFSIMGDQIYAYAPAGATGTVDVVVTTSAGSSATSPADQFTYQAAAPTVSSVTPASDPGADANEVIVTGTNFTNVSQVLFGGTPATRFTVDSPTQITAWMPATQSAGPMAVQVVASGMTSAATPAGQYTPASSAPSPSSATGQEPTVTSFSLVPGTFDWFRITGTNFTHVRTVTLNPGPGSSAAFLWRGAHPLAVYWVVSPEEIIGYGSITEFNQTYPWVYTTEAVVTTDAGASALSPVDRFTTRPFTPYNADGSSAVPTVFGLRVEGDSLNAMATEVVVTGSNFTNVEGIWFSGNPAWSYHVDSPSQITVYGVRGGLGDTDEGVRVLAAGGYSPDAFDYLGSGTGFWPTVEPSLDLASAGGNSFAVGQSVTLSATVHYPSGSPAGPTGKVGFFVMGGTAPLGYATLSPGPDNTATASLSVSFPKDGVYTVWAGYEGDKLFGYSIGPPIAVTVIPLVPALTGLSPDSAVEGSAAIPLTVQGSQFAPDAVVQWNGNPLPTTFVNDSELAVTLPAADLAEEGSAQVTVVNPGNAGGTSDPVTFTVADASLTATGTTIQATEGNLFSGVLATFSDPAPDTDADPRGPLGDYGAKVDWGDGSPIDQVQVVATGPATFNVVGRHTYSRPGSYTATVTMHDMGGSTVSVQSVVNVADAALAADGIPLTAIKGNALQAQSVATFTDDNPDSSPGDFAATIDWGDGTSSPGTVVQDDAGLFEVLGDHTYTSAGSIPVTVTITDQGGETATASSTATINGLVLDTFSVPALANEGDTVSFAAQAFADSVDGLLTYTWDFGDGTTASAADLTNPTHVYAANLSSDTPYTVTLAVANSAFSVSQSSTVAVTEPAPDFSAGPEQVVHPGDEVAFAGTATEAGDSADIPSIQWDFNYDGTTFQADPSADGTLTPSHAFSTEGTYAVALQVTDAGGNVSLDVTTVEVKTLFAQAGPDQNVTPGSTVSLAGSYSDQGGTVSPDGIAWDFNYDDQTFNPMVTGTLTPTYTVTDPGTHRVALRVTDDQGRSDISVVTVNAAYVGPTAQAGADQVIREGDTASFSGSFTDPDSTVAPSQFAWDFNYDGTFFNPQVTGTLTPTWQYTQAGSYQVALQVTDENGLTSLSTLDLTVTYVPLSVTAGPDQVINVGDTASFTGSFDAPAGSKDNATYAWDFNYDGQIFQPGVADSLTAFHTFTHPGTYTVAFEVTDSNLDSGLSTLQVTVRNVPALVVNAGPDQFVSKDSAVLLSGSFIDLDGWGMLEQAKRVSWDFHYDGVTFHPDSSFEGDITPNLLFTSPGTYLVALRVTDQNNVSNIGTLYVHVADVAPQVYPGPDQTINEGATANFKASVTPIGGASDIADVQWDFDYDGVTFNPDPSAAGSLTPSHSYAAAGTYTAAVQVTDQYGTSTLMTLTVTVQAVPTATTSNGAITTGTVTGDPTGSPVIANSPPGPALVSAQASSTQGKGAGNASLTFDYFPLGLSLVPATSPVPPIPENPTAHSLRDLEARLWYLLEEERIPYGIDPTKSLKDQAMAAAERRNTIRTLARDYMKNTAKAAEMAKDNPNLTWEQALGAARNRYFKEHEVLLEEGDKLYEEVIRGTQYSRGSVDKALGIERLAQPKLPSEVQGKALPTKPNVNYTTPEAQAGAAAEAAEAATADEAATASRLSTLLGGAKGILGRVGRIFATIGKIALPITIGYDFIVRLQNELRQQDALKAINEAFGETEDQITLIEARLAKGDLTKEDAAVLRAEHTMMVRLTLGFELKIGNMDAAAPSDAIMVMSTYNRGLSILHKLQKLENDLLAASNKDFKEVISQGEAYLDEKLGKRQSGTDYWELSTGWSFNLNPMFKFVGERWRVRWKESQPWQDVEGFTPLWGGGEAESKEVLDKLSELNAKLPKKSD